MDLLSFIILLIFTFFLVMILLFFFRNNKELKLQHIEEVNGIKKSILIHKTQIKVRNNGLNSYNFIKYNLNDSLKVQSEINLF